MWKFDIYFLSMVKFYKIKKKMLLSVTIPLMSKYLSKSAKFREWMTGQVSC